MAVLDCDDDGRPDLYLAGGVNGASLYRNESAVGEIAFTPVEDGTAALTGVTGAYPVDIDSDGITDLAVLGLGENVVLRGLGDCQIRASQRGMVDRRRRRLDGRLQRNLGRRSRWPTLVFGNYVELSPSGEQDRPLLRPPPLRPSGGSYADPTTLSPGWCTLSGALQRLGPIRTARPPDDQRPALLPRW